MLKKTLSACFSAIIVVSMILTLAEGGGVVDDRPTEEVIPKLHVYTGEPVSPIPEELWEIDSRGGKHIPTPKYDFSNPDATFENRGIGLVWTDLGDGTGAHRVTVENEGAAKYLRSDTFEIKPNTNYLMSVLAWFDFSRYYQPRNFNRELSFCLIATDKNGVMVLRCRRGVPDYTNGWVRFEFVVSTGLMEAGVNGQLDFYTAGFTNGAPESSIYIADYKVFELPPAELIPYKEGEGMVFRGGAGGLDMKVEGTESNENLIAVDTTGARYTFDLVNDTISAEQKISKKRNISTWKSDVSFKGLSIRSKTENECVIANENISFGVQLDGSVFLTPHKGDVRLVCTSEIAGSWNRLNFGYLLAFDDYGGFSVTPDIPVGTGKTSKYEVLTENLDFPQYEFSNAMSSMTPAYQTEYNTHISNAKPGWQIAWTVSPGERLAITTFPPREYDWENSFELNYSNVAPTAAHLANMEMYKIDYKAGAVVLWDFNHHRSGMEFGRYYLHDRTESYMRSFIKRADELDMHTLSYVSGYFYYNGAEPTEFVNEVTRLKNTYEIDGVYSDGLPSEWKWITAYEEARMLRELFPDGTLIVHNTGVPGNGGPPMSAAGLFLPMVDTYLTATLKGEQVGLIGAAAPLANMTWPQYNISNCIGIQKGDKWVYYNDKDERVMIPQTAQDLILLIQNGRARLVSEHANWMSIYIPTLHKLRDLWQTHGHEEDFYEKYYAPTARNISRKHLEFLGDISALDEGFGSDENLEKYNISNVNTEVVSSESESVLKVSGCRNYNEGSVFKRISSVSGPISVEYRFKVGERGDFEQIVTDNYGASGVGLCFGKDGKIKLKNSEGGFAIIGKYKKNAWYNVKIELDTDRQRYSIYVNGQRLVANMGLDEELYRISNFEFFGGGYGSVFYLDDFKVSYSF